MRIFLQAPFLTARAAVVAGHAGKTTAPVCLAGGPGRGAYRVARALHRLGDPLGFVSVRRLLGGGEEVEARIRAALNADPAIDAISLFVERIDVQPLSVQEAVLRCTDEGVRSNGRTLPVRLLGQIDSPDPADATSLCLALRHRLIVQVLALPPLSERGEEIAAIASLLVAEISRSARRPPPAFSSDALQGLREWTGEVDELEAVLARATIEARSGRIEGVGLREPVEGVIPIPTSPAASTSASTTVEEISRLESVITELAHELKNPMVTIKTFAQHMDELFGDSQLREKFSRLTSEAIERMDGFLDDLLQFARFSAPSPRPEPLADLLARSVAQLEPSAREHIQQNGLPRDLRVLVDADQVVFAVRSLIRGVSRELPAGTAIVLSSRGSNEIRFRGKVGGSTRKLQSLLSHNEETGSETSLHFVLADTLIQRNRGTIRFVREEGYLEARLSLPLADG